jgi:predicted metal-dependent phosphoesterase TrpH
MNRIIIIGLIFVNLSISAQTTHTHLEGRSTAFPDVPGYVTLVSDLHIHTVFSDGSVWPDIRIKEGNKDGLDVISMTEHLEYQPHEEDIPHPDRNRSYEIAQDVANDWELIVIKGLEITRDMPPGHSNAIFIQDANKILMDKPEDVFEEAQNQGAFIFWNHPNWIDQ